MNPQDDNQNYWDPQDQPQAAASQSEPPATEDYPTETYQPAEPIDELGRPLVEEPQGQPGVVVDEPPVTWTAKEYVELDKGRWWYVIAILIALLLIAVDILWLKSYTFSALIVVMTVALAIYIRRPPREIQYTLSGRQGLYVGEKLYHLSEFRAFGLIKDGDHHSIMLIPIKRFSPGVSVYFPEEAGEQIVDILGQRLPMETLKLDVIDVLVRKLRL